MEPHGATLRSKAEEGKVKFFSDNFKETEKNSSLDAKVEIQNSVDDDHANILLSSSNQSNSVKNKRCPLELPGDSSETSLLPSIKTGLFAQFESRKATGTQQNNHRKKTQYSN